MKANKLLFPMNLQFFASDTGANGGANGDNTDPNNTGETNPNTGDQTRTPMITQMVVKMEKKPLLRKTSTGLESRKRKAVKRLLIRL